MSKVSVIIPFRNELDLITHAHTSSRKLLRMGLEIVWVNDGSKDDGEKVLRNLISQDEQIVQTSGIGILSAFLEGCKHASGDIFVFLPLDCNLSGLAYESLTNGQFSVGKSWGAFEKTYDSKGMSLYAFLQNKVLLRSGVVAWTNVFIVPRKLLEGIEQDFSFPSDLRFSGALSRKARLQILSGKVEVSARKYRKDGRGVRILQNGFILTLYWLGIRGDYLEKFYRRSMMGNLIVGTLVFLLCSLAFLQAFASTSQRAPVRRSGGSGSQRPIPPRNYQAPARNNVGSGTQRSSPPSNTSSKPYRYVPVQWSQESIENWVFSLPRRNVAIHNVQRSGNEIRIEGSFSSKESLDSFANSLAGDGKREVKVETKTYYTMGINRDYIIILENEF